jgi:hypothetical protein
MSTAPKGKPLSKPRDSNLKKVQLRLYGIDILSAIKFGFFISLAAAIATVIGALLIWSILSNSGVLANVGGLITSLFGDQSGINLEESLSFGSFMLNAALFAGLNIVVLTALAGVWAAIFNVISRLVGGIKLTFTSSS